MVAKTKLDPYFKYKDILFYFTKFPVKTSQLEPDKKKVQPNVEDFSGMWNKPSAPQSVG